MPHEPIHLFDDYYFRDASAAEFWPFFREHRPMIFADAINIEINDTLTGVEKDKLNQLHHAIDQLYTQRLFILKNEEIIGLHIGTQVRADLYNMGATGLLKEYQGKGIYSALLPKLLEIYHDKGFQKISSRHHASNNRVLVAKIKAGFVITGFELDERYGLFVVLSYIYNDKRMKAYKFFTGSLRPDEEIKKHL
jgi:GNAT superfamily N-acetyltransferase